MKKAIKRNKIVKNDKYISGEKGFYKTLFDKRQTRDDEEWRDVVGYEGLYKVSNYGLVINSDCRIVGTYYNEEQSVFKSPFKDVNRYNVVGLYKNRKRTLYQIHRLVAMVFVENPNPSEFNTVNHIDENIHNNYYKNLEWCTTQYNLHYGSANQKRANSRRKSNNQNCNTTIRKEKIDIKF